MAESPRKMTSLKVAAAWIFVAIPLGWGVYQSVVKSLPLFRAVTPVAGTGADRPQSPRDVQ
ncbi:hypothetical protein V5E97_01115 [Singulisphaera sp. Ch08]|uniref:Oxalate:formate antiporter n=1 Tax=Singulisphaera sp. Ch08 TaxID=3120278 RepID=A0AAU7CGP9_9BACT